MWILRIILRKPKEFMIAALSLVIVGLFGYIRIQGIEYKKNLLAYKNPAVKEVIKEVRVEGPVVVKWRTVTEPGGRKIEERVEERAIVTITKDGTRESKPVFLATRQNRWLVGASLEGDYRQARHYRMLAGYGLANRIDVMGGIGYDRDPKLTAQVVLRF